MMYGDFSHCYLVRVVFDLIKFIKLCVLSSYSIGENN